MKRTIISAASPQWANVEQTRINLMVNFVEVGEVPFTASSNDTEAHGVELYNRAVAGDFGSISAYQE